MYKVNVFHGLGFNKLSSLANFYSIDMRFVAYCRYRKAYMENAASGASNSKIYAIFADIFCVKYTRKCRTWVFSPKIFTYIGVMWLLLL